MAKAGSEIYLRARLPYLWQLRGGNRDEKDTCSA